MYYDPFLSDHEVEIRQYELSNGVQPVSIRDQILRGTEIVTRLIACGIVPRDTGKLLVVGGGVAGFSAALAAIARGISVTVLEAGATYFSRFNQCNSRRIDPTFYDWPLPHWRTHTFNAPKPPLAFLPNSIDAIAITWQKVVHGAMIQKGSLLKVCNNTSFKPTHISRKGNIICYEPSVTVSETYDAVLYSAGMGEERVWLDDSILPSQQYCGPQFWHSDQLHQRWCGKLKQPAVLIAGSGDGALQDYIRILTGLHPAEVLEKLDNGLSRMSGWQDAQYRLLAAQDQAARQYTLGCKSNFHKVQDKVIEAKLHVAFLTEVKSLFSTCGTNIKGILDVIVKARKADLPRILHLLIAGKAFTWCYGANRFLALLLSEYLSRKYHGKDTFLGKTLLYDSVLTRTDLGGRNARVATDGKLQNTLKNEDYDIIIIRFGIKRSPSLCPSGKPPRQRSMMPSQFL